MRQNVDVLAIFDIGALHPRPIKFKLMECGLKKTVNVVKVHRVDWVGSGYVKRIVYDCSTPLNGREIKYRLSFYYKENRWEVEV